MLQSGCSREADGVVIWAWPHPAAQGLRRALDSFPSPTHTLTEGGHTDGEAADYIICEVRTFN